MTSLEQSSRRLSLTSNEDVPQSAHRRFIERFDGNDIRVRLPRLREAFDELNVTVEDRFVGGSRMGSVETRGKVLNLLGKKKDAIAPRVSIWKQRFVASQQADKQR